MPRPDATSKKSTTGSSGIRPVIDGVGDPACDICRGMGYIRLDVPLVHPNFGKLFPCTCRMEELAQHRDRSLRSVNNLQAVKQYTFESFSLDGQGISQERQRNLRYAYETALAYARKPEGWLVLIGGYGCGKTHLAAAIANHVLKSGVAPLFVTVPDLLDHLRSTFAPGSPQPYSERFDQVRNTPLLILDDLGTENATPWALEKLFQLLNHRYMARLATVVTTNQDLEYIDARLRSRLVDPDLVEIVTILAPDHRMIGVDERFASSLDMLPYYADMTFGTFDPRQRELDEDEAHSLATALQLAKSYADNPEGWIVFTGTYGVGKTHLAAAIANERLRQGHPALLVAAIANERLRQGHPALLVVVPDLLDYLRAAFSPQSSVSLGKRFEEVRRVPMLVLDDLGTESATPWAREKLFQLINYRYVARLPTIVTSSTELKDMDPKISIRFMDTSRCTIQDIRTRPFLGGAGRTSGRTKRSRGRK